MSKYLIPLLLFSSCAPSLPTVAWECSIADNHDTYVTVTFSEISRDKALKKMRRLQKVMNSNLPKNTEVICTLKDVSNG